MIKYRLKLIKSKGQIEASEVQLPGPTFIIGRGENADIRFEDALVSYRHAELTETKKSLRISDLNSFSGTKVNNKTIQRDELQDGDIISIGLYNIEIKREGENWILAEERRLDRAKGEDAFISSTLKSTTFRDNLPSMTMLSLLLVTAILVAFFWIPLTTTSKNSWSSGPISNEHKLLSNDCSTCHQVPFEKVSNNTCTDCHKMGGHRMDLHANHTLDKLLCTNCHSEHNGSEGLIVEDEALCLSCHRDLAKTVKNTKIQSLDGFQHHPDFKIHSFLEKAKLPLKEAKDSNSLKLNHKIHLNGPINGAVKKEILDCGSCHVPNENKKGFKSINFETSCERCHSLSFSKLTPEVKAPHGSPDEVFSFLLRFYANESLIKEGEVISSADERFIPGKLDKRSLELFFLRKEVINQSRKMEHELFTKLSCAVCHEVKKLPTPLANENSSSFKITPPEDRATWFRGATFDHSAHSNMQCKECHNGANKSKLTSEVLIPDVKSCKECHGDQGHAKKVSSTCISCHPYHQTEQEKSHIENVPK